MESALARYLAQRAQALELDLQTVEGADSERLRAFALVVLQELAALGLLPAEREVDCWAVPRSELH